MHLSHRAVFALSVVAGLALSGSAFAHGTMTKPLSRVKQCHEGNPENPTNPACAAAKAIGGAQPFYDWSAIAHGNANGNHRELVRDGELCSASIPKYRGLDLNRTDWPTTPIRADARGRYTFEFYAPAPHATREWKLYVTRDGWQPGSRCAGPTCRNSAHWATCRWTARPTSWTARCPSAVASTSSTTPAAFGFG